MTGLVPLLVPSDDQAATATANTTAAPAASASAAPPPPPTTMDVDPEAAAQRAHATQSHEPRVESHEGGPGLELGSHHVEWAGGTGIMGGNGIVLVQGRIRNRQRAGLTCAHVTLFLDHHNAPVNSDSRGCEELEPGKSATLIVWAKLPMSTFNDRGELSLGLWASCRWITGSIGSSSGTQG